MTARTAPRIFIVGAGRAGRSLAAAWRAADVEVIRLRRRGASWRGLRRATVVVVAVRDAELRSALAEICAAPLMAGAVILHTSGALDPGSALAPLRGAGHPAGTFHPIVPLADATRAPALLRGAWIGIDGDRGARRAARALAAALGARTLVIPAGDRALYHAAAVFGANFPVVLVAVAERLMQRSGVGSRAARAAVRALLRATTDNLAHADPARALTGPAARGDRATIARHVAVLAGQRPVADAYRALSRLARQLVSPAR